MKTIDPLTLVFTAGVLAFMASGFLFLLRKSLSHRVHGIRPWAYAMLLGWVSTTLRWEQGVVPKIFSLVVSNGLLMLAMGLMLYGLRRFNGQPPRVLPIWLFGAVVLSFIAWFSLVDDVFYLRIAATCVYALVLFPLSAHAAFVGRSVFKSPARMLIGWLFIGISAVMLLELIDALTMGPALKGFDAGSLANLLFVGSFNVLIFGLFFGFVMLINDRLRAELASLANTDALTLTLNRRAFMEEASRVLANERRQQRPCGLLMLDLDHFKLVNDNFGHVRGDRVLKYFADRVRERLRGGDVFGRYGGEEFLVLLPGAGVDAALVLAEQLRARVAEAPLGLDGEKTELTVSVGLAVDMGEGGISELIEAADWALYRAKHRGRNCVVMFGGGEDGGGAEA